ncbi:signal peptidase I [Desulfovibrio sp. OttesenSCG-928-A18]|nr:signal peptidase I [Desulfovibrio sp. OttesenSCG-928-A18]
MAEIVYKTNLQTFIDFIKIIIAALFIALLIRSFIIQPYIIPSESMLNTLQIGDRLFVTKFSYGIHIPFVEKELFSTGEPEIGDIIVFPYPLDKSQDYIKRVVGVPGDVIEVRDKQLYRNGQPAQEEYIIHKDKLVVPTRDTYGPVTVPAGHVFVMGDNRDNSQDSRYWGFVDKQTIHGKALIIYWSSTRFVDVKWDRIGTWLR